MSLNSALYTGEVAHVRLRPKHHRFRYSVFTMLLDLDELPELDRRIRLFGYNRRAPIRFNDSDHGPTTKGSLKPWVENHLRQAGLKPDGGAIRLLCYPRIFGFVFNPISIFFCYNKNDELVAILHEVCNTYSERHTYVIPVEKTSRKVVRQTCSKDLYVSPFNDMDGEYHFRIIPPEDKVSIVIRHEDCDGLLLAAAFRGNKIPISGKALAKHLLRFPLLTMKVVAGIHYEAARLWLKGLHVFSHSPAALTVDSTIKLNLPSRR